jgi:hypothetical protein
MIDLGGADYVVLAPEQTARPRHPKSDSKSECDPNEL